MLKKFQNVIESKAGDESTALVLSDSKEKHSLSILEEDEIDTYNVLVTDTSMYDVSKRLKMLQSIYDYRLVAVWYDNILPQYELETKQPVKPIADPVKPKTREISSSYVGTTLTMNCGMRATVIEDFGCKDITIQFEDGLIRKHCRRDKFREGKIAHKE